MKYSIPLVLFVLVLVLLSIGLEKDPRHVPSPLIDKPLPDFALPTVRDPGTLMTSADIKGRVSLLNVWASWCTACRTEHPLLLRLSQNDNVMLYGINYKDERQNALAWLNEFGDPYRSSVFDQDGRTGIDLGVYGVPETFVLDSHGIIRYKHIGPLTPELLQDILLPLLQKLENTSS